MSEEKPSRPKLIIPDAESTRPKSQLLVPGDDGQPTPVEPAEPEPTAEPQAEVEEDGLTVINEDTGDEEHVGSDSGPVKIQEMAPPPVEEEVEAEPEEVAGPAEQAPPVEEAAPVETAETMETVEAAPVAAEEYAAPPEAPVTEEYVQEQDLAAAEPTAEAYTYEQAEAPPVYAEEQYQASVAEQAYQQPPAPAYAPPPPPPAAYQAPAPPVTYGAPPVHQMAPAPVYGGATMPMVGQPRGVPGWALFLLGLLAGFLITLALFKFTALAEGLRPDLVERGKRLVKTKPAETTEETPDDNPGDTTPDTPPGGASDEGGAGAGEGDDPEGGQPTDDDGSA